MRDRFTIRVILLYFYVNYALNSHLKAEYLTSDVLYNCSYVFSPYHSRNVSKVKGSEITIQIMSL